jgi:hypothetical protein
MTMVTEEQHLFATYPWDTVPFEVNPKIAYDKLLDILLLIPGCLSVVNQIKGIYSLDITEAHELRIKLESSVSTLLRRLQEWWWEYAEEHASHGRDANSFGEPQSSSTSNEPYYPNAFAAACTASYHAAMIVLYAMHTFCSYEAHTYEAQIEWHSSRILVSCSYMMMNRTSSAGTVMMVFPLKSMCRCSQNQLQKQAAFEILGKWGEKKGIHGICSQAAPFFDVPIISPSTFGSFTPQYLHDEHEHEQPII